MKIEKLQYITNGSSEEAIINEVTEVIDAGCKWIQLRIKQESLDFKAIAQKVKVLCAGKTTLIFNDNVELARELDVDGVHLGLSDMPIPKARMILGGMKIIGGTANTAADCLERQKSGADYIGLGPFRFTKTKDKLSPILGLSGYKLILNDQPGIAIPVVAIGGIREQDVAELKRDTPVFGVALSRLISENQNKKELVVRLLNVLE